MNFLFAAIFIVFTLSGCASNFSNVAGYREYVGRKISLQKPVYLIEAKADIARDSRYMNPHYVDIPAGTLYLMVDIRNSSSVGIELPAQTPLNVQEIVCQSTSGSSLEVQARGTVFVSELNKTVKFLYVYAYEDQCVRRAPWEEKNLPLWRKFDTGKVDWCEKSSLRFEKKYE